MKLIQFNSRFHRPTLEEALACIDKLREDMASGKVVGFFAAALNEEDETFGYIGTSKRVSRLRMMGALFNALHIFQHDEI